MDATGSTLHRHRWRYLHLKLPMAGLAVLSVISLASCGGSPKSVGLDRKVGLIPACSLLTAKEAGAIVTSDPQNAVPEYRMPLNRPMGPRDTSGCGYNAPGIGSGGGLWIQLSHGPGWVKAFEETDWAHDNPPATRLTIDGTTVYWFGEYLTATKDGYVVLIDATPWDLGEDRSAMTLALPRIHHTPA